MKPTETYHKDVLDLHRTGLYGSLIHERHIITRTLKEIEFEGLRPLRGFFAVKDKSKYFIDESIVDDLPIKVRDQNEELLHKEDVVIRPLNPIRFKITPEDKVPLANIVNEVGTFEHTNLIMWKLAICIAIAGYTGKTFIGMCTTSGFGKSSLFRIIDALTELSPVFKPRTVPGVLKLINSTGNMVMDEIQKCKTEVRDIIEEFALVLGDGNNRYVNGAMAAKGLKGNYNCTLQSITFLYNTMNHYKLPEKQFFDFIFANNKAIDRRFLKLKLDGILTQRFGKKFNIPLTAKDNKMYYINIAKTLLYHQQAKLRNEYVKRYTHSNNLNLLEMQHNTFEEIMWVVDHVARDQDEYNLYHNTLVKCITGYKDMVDQYKNGSTVNVSDGNVIQAEGQNKCVEEWIDDGQQKLGE